jgi:broad specificity phosphatase PhoE
MLLVRHGETLANFERRYNGRLDSPLTERGIAQAQAIGRKICTLPESRSAEIVASPQPRARRTAEIIHECVGPGTTPIRLDERLCEVSIGGWEGLSHEEIVALAPGTFEGGNRYEWCFNSPGGETYDVFAARIADWLRDVSHEGPLIVVTHGIVARVLRGLYAGLPRDVALSLPIAQDRIFRLSNSMIEEIVVESEAKIPRIIKAAPLPECGLFVQFDDGVTGTLDVRTVAKEPPAAPLDEAAFQQLTIDDFGAICWPGGPSLFPETLYDLVVGRRH